jgi:hypothetical protein
MSETFQKGLLKAASIFKDAIKSSQQLWMADTNFFTGKSTSIN